MSGRDQDWRDLKFRMEAAVTRLEQQSQEILASGVDEGHKTDEVNRLSAKRSGVLLCLDFMRGYPETL